MNHGPPRSGEPRGRAPAPEPFDPEFPEAVFRARTRRACAEAALVLEAVGFHPAQHEVNGGWLLIVPPAEAAAARREIAAWLAENQRPPEPPRREPVADGRPGVAGYALAMLLVAMATANFAFGKDWLAAGRIDGAAMLAGQWWRALTALTLHADLAHLAGNLFFGGVFGWFAGRYLGSGVAWALVALAGVVGNLVNVATLGFEHRAIGASTAVFAALGLLGGLEWVGRRHSARGRLYRWGPIIAAGALLAFTGTGGERTDVGAHLWGFVVGLGMGLLAARLPRVLLQRPRVQAAAAASTASALVLAWVLALSAGA